MMEQATGWKAGKTRTSRKWPRTDWHDRILRERYDSTPATITDLQRLFAVPRWLVSRWARELGLTGVKHRRWTSGDLLDLEDLLAQGRTDEAIARQLSRSVNAVRLARKRNGLRSRRELLMTLRAVANAMGIPCSKTVAEWARRRWLRARYGPRVGLNRERYVTLEALYDFIKNPRYWPAWRPERIRDARVKAWAGYLRHGRYLRPGEVGEHHHVGHRTVNQWIRKGLLRAIRWGNWWVSESDCAAFTPPCQRSKKGMVLRRWTKEERLRLWALHNDGRTLAEMAEALGRTIGSVHSALVRFQAKPALMLVGAAS